MTDPCTRAASQYAAGDIKRALSNIERCQKDLQAKIKKFRKHPEAGPQLNLSLARAYRFEGQIYFADQNIGKSHTAFTNALNTINKVSETEESLALRGQISYSLGIIAIMRKQLNVGINLLISSKDDFFTAKQAEQAMEMLLRLGGIYRDLGQIDKANTQFEEMQSNMKKIKDKKNRRIYTGRVKLEQGRILMSEDSKKAEKLFNHAKKEFSKSDFNEGAAQVLIELAKIHESEPQNAREYLLEARDLGVMVDSAEIQGMALTQLGVQSLKLGEFEKGKQQLLQGLKFRTEAGDRVGTAQTLVELSRITMLTSRNSQDLETAKNFAEQAVGLYEGESHDFGLASTHELLGSIFLKLGDLEAAKSKIQEGKNLFAKFHDERGEARMLTQLGLIYDKEGRSEKAITVLEKATSVFEKYNNKQGLAEALHVLAMQYRESDPVTAVKYLKQSRQLYAEIIGDNEPMQVILKQIDGIIEQLST